jgi:hypothetical protein
LSIAVRRLHAGPFQRLLAANAPAPAIGVRCAQTAKPNPMHGTRVCPGWCSLMRQMTHRTGIRAGHRWGALDVVIRGGALDIGTVRLHVPGGALVPELDIQDEAQLLAQLRVLQDWGQVRAARRAVSSGRNSVNGESGNSVKAWYR